MSQAEPPQRPSAPPAEGSPRPVRVVHVPSSQYQGQGGGGVPRQRTVHSVGPNGQRIIRYRPNPNDPSSASAESAENKLFSSLYTLFGFGNHEYAFSFIPRGYGLNIASIATCYALLKWERSRIEKYKHKPPFTAQPTWFARLKSAEKEYEVAKNDFPRTVMLMLIGGLGMPYASAAGGIFWVAGRATDFHESEKRCQMNTDPVFCRFGKFLMICGICKLCFDFARGRLSSVQRS